MKLLTLIEKIFISVTYAEERIFRGVNVENFLKTWDRVWMSIAFAEQGICYPEEACRPEGVPSRPIVCELGEVSCFLLRNA